MNLSNLFQYMGLCVLVFSVSANANMRVAMKDMLNYCKTTSPSNVADQRIVLEQARAKFMERFVPLYRDTFPEQGSGVTPKFSIINEKLFDKMKVKHAARLAQMSNDIEAQKKIIAGRNAELQAQGKSPVSLDCDFREADNRVFQDKNWILRGEMKDHYAGMSNLISEVHRLRKEGKVHGPLTKLEEMAAESLATSDDWYAKSQKKDPGEHQAWLKYTAVNKLFYAEMEKLTLEQRTAMVEELSRAKPQNSITGVRGDVKNLCDAQSELGKMPALYSFDYLKKQFPSVKNVSNFGKILNACRGVCESIPKTVSAAKIDVKDVDIGLGIYSGHMLGISPAEGKTFADQGAVDRISAEANRQEPICKGADGTQEIVNSFLFDRAFRTRVPNMLCYDDQADAHGNGCKQDFAEYKELAGFNRKVVKAEPTPAAEPTEASFMYLGSGGSTAVHD